MKIRVHADDLGASGGVNQAIFACHDSGSLGSVSVLVTGEAVEGALEGAATRPGLDLCLHLNLLEGRTLSPPGEVPFLADRTGYFHASITRLLLTHARAGSAQRREFRRQLRRELQAQFAFYFDRVTEPASAAVDSHLHLHLLPFVWPLVYDLGREYGVRRFRMPRTFYFLDGYGTESVFAQLVKAGGLSLLSRCQRNRVAEGSPDHLVTGVISLELLEKLTARLPSDASVELLFHPGCTKVSETEMVGVPDHLRRAHDHPIRAAERDLLRSPELASLLERRRRV